MVDNLAIFPNPSGGQVQISFDVEMNSNVQVEVLDPLSKVVYTEQLNGFKGKYSLDLDLSTYAKGIYHLNIFVDDKQAHETLIIK